MNSDNFREGAKLRSNAGSLKNLCFSSRICEKDLWTKLAETK